MHVQRLAEPVEPRGDLRLDARRVVRPGRREEAVGAAAEPLRQRAERDARRPGLDRVEALLEMPAPRADRRELRGLAVAGADELQLARDERVAQLGGLLGLQERGPCDLAAARGDRPQVHGLARDGALRVADVARVLAV